MSAAALASGRRRFFVAASAGVATGLLTRVILLIVSRPHSVLFPPLPLWQAGVSVLAGLTVGILAIRFLRSTGPVLLISSALFLVGVCAVRYALFGIRVADRLVPGSWIK